MNHKNILLGIPGVSSFVQRYESLFSAGSSLSSMPRRYAERDGGCRKMIVSRYHYIIRYELVIDPDNAKRQSVLILSVWHPAQDR